MGFLSPLFLAGALAASIPIVLHLLKREPENRVRFSAVHLLRRAPVEHSSRRRLRELLLLALRVAALLLLALAFARPFFTSDVAAATGTTVVALDTSLSLSAPGQFEKAQELAKRVIDEAGRTSLVGIVTFSDSAQVVTPPTADHASARAAIAAAAPGSGSTRYRAALNAGVDLLRGRPGTIVVVTDLQETGWDSGEQAMVPATVQVKVVDVGEPPANLAVTAARISGDRIVATIRNTGAQATTARVQLEAGDRADATATPRVVSESAVPVGGGQSASVSFPAPTAKWASVTVDDPTGARADNARYIVLDTASRPAVLVITTSGDLARDAFYLEQALGAAGEEGGAYAVRGVAAGDLTSWDQARLDAHASVVLLSTRALEHHGRELLTAYVKKGGGMIVAAGPDVDGDVLQEVLAGPRISIVHPDITGPGARVTRTWAASDVRHPVVRAFGPTQAALGLVQFQRVAVMRTDDCAVLARFTTSEPALVDCASGDGHALVIASDLDNRGNDFPLHGMFVPFVHEAVHYLAGSDRQAAEYLVGEAPPGIPAVPGIATASQRPASNLIAVNVNPAELDPGRLSADEFLGAVVSAGGGAQAGARLQASEQEDRQHIWQYVLAVMLVMLVMETWVAAKVA